MGLCPWDGPLFWYDMRGGIFAKLRILFLPVEDCIGFTQRSKIRVKIRSSWEDKEEEDWKVLQTEADPPKGLIIITYSTYMWQLRILSGAHQWLPDIRSQSYRRKQVLCFEFGSHSSLSVISSSALTATLRGGGIRNL